MVKARPFLNRNWHEVRFHKLVSCEILTLKKSQQDDEAGCVHRDYSSWSQARAIRKFLFVVFNISYHILSKKSQNLIGQLEHNDSNLRIFQQSKIFEIESLCSSNPIEF